MALIQCPEPDCAKRVSSRADKCPHCGCPLGTDTRGTSTDRGQATAAPLNPKLTITDEMISQLDSIIAKCGSEIEHVVLVGDWRDRYLERLLGFQKLTRLELFSTSKITDVGLVEIARIGTLRRVEFIPGCGEKVTSSGLRSLARLKNLELLKLGFSALNPKLADAIRYLQKELPMCVIK
jgi:hypothetical protein